MAEKFTKEELDFLCKGASDFPRKKYTDCKCTRCGNEFEFYEAGASFELRCKTNDCLKLTCRGL